MASYAYYIKRLAFSAVALSISACAPNPISATLHVVNAGLMYKSDTELKKRQAFEQFQETCLWPRFNAIELADIAWKAEDAISTHHYLRIAQTLNHPNAVPRLKMLRPMMRPEDIKTAEALLAKHTAENIHSCYTVAEYFKPPS